MKRIFSVLWSSVGKKYISGITGLMLFSFLVVHLVGNFTLLSGAETFNSYAHFLEGLAHGWFIYAAEAVLIVLFVSHVIAGIAVTVDGWRARPESYKKNRNAGGASMKSWSSRTMFYTGLIILVFLPIHIVMFKFGGAGMVESDGASMKDFFTLVTVDFTNPYIAFGYGAVMFLVGMHLKHGFWSAFQSLGLNTIEWKTVLHRLALVMAIFVGGGFLLLPLYFYLSQ